jgi:hypothetical protein
MPEFSMMLRRLQWVSGPRLLCGSEMGSKNGLLTRAQLALELKVSLRTVDCMLADGEITPMRLREKLMRFYLPDVLQELREKAKTSKRNVARRV